MAITKIQSESMNLADTYAFTGTVTGAGENNTPAFSCKSSSNQMLVILMHCNKINFYNRNFDSDGSCYDALLIEDFTVPTGEAGKYLFKSM